MSDHRLDIVTELIEGDAPENPQAAIVGALGRLMLADVAESRAQLSALYEAQIEENRLLREENRQLAILAERYLAIRRLLTDPPEYA